MTGNPAAGPCLLTTTIWDDLSATQADDPADRRAALERVIARYWKPVYAYLRACGHDPEQAADLTQGFFTDVVLERNLIGRADPGRGRFRSLLLTALNHYRLDDYRRASSKKRRPEHRVIALDHTPGGWPEPCSREEAPDRAFVRVWVSELLDGCLAECRRAYLDNNKPTHWQVFHDRLLDPVLRGGEVPSYQSLAEHYGLAGEKQAANMVLTVRRRFASILRRHLRGMVDDASEVDRELNELLAQLRCA